MAKKRMTVPSVADRLKALSTLMQWQHQLVASLIADTESTPPARRRRRKKASGGVTSRPRRRKT